MSAIPRAGYHLRRPPRPRPAGLAGLTSRQREIGLLVAQGLPNRTIARRLGISDQTVKNALHAAMIHLDVPDRLNLAREFWREGLGL